MTQVIGFGGGCHWCTEAVFAALPTERVEQGWIGSVSPDDALSEAVRVTFDPARITLGALIATHLRTHASGSDHSMRGKYRSAVYTTSEEQAAEAAVLLDAARARRRLVTRALPLLRFEPSPERYQRYYEKRPGAPFCRTYIAPKLEALREG